MSEQKRILYSDGHDVPWVGSLVMTLFVLFAVWRRRQSLDQPLVRRRKKVGWEAQFPKSVQALSSAVYEDALEHSSSEPLLPPAEEGTYQVALKPDTIADKKTGDVFASGEISTGRLTLQLSRRPDCGYTITGTRRGTCGLFAVERGMVSNSGKSYWLESNTEISYLTSGQFQENGRGFEGEWLSNKGERGTYTEFASVALGPGAPAGASVASEKQPDGAVSVDDTVKKTAINSSLNQV